MNRGWNVWHLPQDAQEGLTVILNRDYGHIINDPEEKGDTDYPLVFDRNGDLAWKEDAFFVSLMTSGLLALDFTALAMDPLKQAFRRRVYKRLGYSLQKYNALWHCDAK
jgi:hypothetical protein